MVTTDPRWDVHVGFVTLDRFHLTYRLLSAAKLAFECAWSGVITFFLLSDSPGALLSLLAF